MLQAHACDRDGLIKSISLVPTLARVSINGHSHTTSTFACIQYIPTNHRHAVACFMRGVTLQFWMLHRKQPRNDINFYLLLKSSNRVSTAVNVLPNWSDVKVKSR